MSRAVLQVAPAVASHTSTYGVYTNMIDLPEKEMLLSHTFKNSFGDVRLVDRH